MDEMKAVTDKLEYLFARTMITGLRDNTMTKEEVGEAARAFLKLRPFASVDETRSKIAQFITVYKPFQSLNEYMNAYEKEQKVEQVITRIRGHLKDNDVDKALDVAKNT